MQPYHSSSTRRPSGKEPGKKKLCPTKNHQIARRKNQKEEKVNHPEQKQPNRKQTFTIRQAMPRPKLCSIKAIVVERQSQGGPGAADRIIGQVKRNQSNTQRTRQTPTWLSTRPKTETNAGQKKQQTDQ
jgi:hypothetical protein